MREFPHHYTASAAGSPNGDVTLGSGPLQELRSAAPAEFDGPGDRWSPETLLTAAIADCFVLTFRAIAKSSGLPWLTLACHASGTLDRVDRVPQFTGFAIKASLRVPVGADVDQARRLLGRAERGCLIANSLKARVDFDMEISVEQEAHIAA